MLVNHVTEKTNPQKFPAGHIRQQVIAIKDPAIPKIAAACKMLLSAKSHDEFIELFIDLRFSMFGEL